LCGAIFGSQELRLVKIDDHHVEAVPEGHLLVLKNLDHPGVIASVSGILAAAGVNISMFNLSRRRIEGKAVSLIGVDTQLSPEVLQRIACAEGVLLACPINLPPASNWNTN
jgi:D-3-phosphoglycerate dehydrogenase